MLEIRNRKAKALIGYLALAPGHTETREKLAGLLWNENNEEKARASLRQALLSLRDICSDGVNRLICARHDVRLNSSLFACDVDDVLAGVALGSALHPLLFERERLADTLMEGFDDIDPSFRIWLHGKRQSLFGRIERGLELWIEKDRPDADIEQAATALLHLDPTDERAARVLMSRRAAAGDVGGALAIHKALWDVLEKDFDTEPSQQTRDLLAQIKLMQPADTAAPALGPKQGSTPVGGLLARIPGMLPLNLVDEPKLVISVGEFDVEAVSAEQRHLVKIFRKHLTATLVRFREWVIRDDAPGDGDAGGGAAAGGEYVVTAVANEVPQGVHLVLTLRETRSRSCHWGDEFLVSREKWYETQHAIVRRLATALNVYLSAGRLASIETRPVNDLKANDLWLLGQLTFQHFDALNWDKAADLFRQVIMQVPTFAPAYSSLAQLNNTYHMVMPGMFRDAQRTEEALVCAHEAARLDPVDSRSQLCLAWSHAMAKQHDQAIVFAAMANELNENDPWTTVSAAGCLAVCGEYQRARELAERALQLPLARNPLQWAYHVSIRFMSGDYAGAVQAATTAGSFSYVQAYKAAALYHLGEHAAGAEELAGFISHTRSRWVGVREPSDENILRWLLSMIPIKHAGDWERVRGGLAGLGAPVGLLAHDVW